MCFVISFLNASFVSHFFARLKTYILTCDFGCRNPNLQTSLILWFPLPYCLYIIMTLHFLCYQNSNRMSHLVFYFVSLLYAHLASYQVRSFKAWIMVLLAWESYRGGHRPVLEGIQHSFIYHSFPTTREHISFCRTQHVLFSFSMALANSLGIQCVLKWPLNFFFVQLLAIIKIFCILAYPCNGKTLPWLPSSVISLQGWRQRGEEEKSNFFIC